MIPLLDLDAQYAAVQRPLEDAVLEVLRSGHYVLGEPVAAFEREFAAYCGTQHAVALNSGTSALHLALMAAGIGPGDEVVTVAMTFVATVAAILYTGATPVLVDVDPATFTMDPRHSRRRSRLAPVRLSPCTCTDASPTWRRSAPSPKGTASP